MNWCLVLTSGRRAHWQSLLTQSYFSLVHVTSVPVRQSRQPPPSSSCPPHVMQLVTDNCHQCWSRKRQRTYLPSSVTGPTAWAFSISIEPSTTHVRAPSEDERSSFASIRHFETPNMGLATYGNGCLFLWNRATTVAGDPMIQQARQPQGGEGNSREWNAVPQFHDHMYSRTRRYPCPLQGLDTIQEFRDEILAVFGDEMGLDFVGTRPTKPAAKRASAPWHVHVPRVPFEFLSPSKAFLAIYTDRSYLVVQVTTAASPRAQCS
ncbi:hypothetical protein BC826DRAFT_1174045 [Russula brevipes]|nr:hypothetical protein BC826DRAFT_1174045 [Russula brevipes]